MNGTKRSAEVVGCQNTSVGERSALGGSTSASRCGRSGSENVGLSNANIGENPMQNRHSVRDTGGICKQRLALKKLDVSNILYTLVFRSVAGLRGWSANNYMTNWGIKFYAYHINILKPVMSLKIYHEVGLPI
jgi:hypothetical protein